MRKATKHMIIEILKDYPRLDQYIRDREADLRNPVMIRDDNVGGGKGTRTNAEEARRLNMIVTISEDERLNALKREKKAVDNCLDDCGKVTEHIISELYFRKNPHSIEYMCEAQEIPVSQAKAYRLRQDFFEDLARELGIFSM